MIVIRFHFLVKSIFAALQSKAEALLLACSWHEADESISQLSSWLNSSSNETSSIERDKHEQRALLNAIKVIREVLLCV